MSTSAHARQRGPWRAQLHAKSRGAAAAAALLRAAFFNSHVNSMSSTLHPNLPTQNLASSSHTAVSNGSYASYNSTSTSASAASGTHKKKCTWWPLGGTKG
ncbi:hypothetical protein B0H14DRAFT_3508642 [Mycena olivaceomarginata]|nr:hypothetical protein B0H14DRAFT_3508642 [Mycena olivaceomarginata]